MRLLCFLFWHFFLHNVTFVLFILAFLLSCLVVMDEALIVWHYRRKLAGNMYIGGAVSSQKIDPNRLGFWCLQEYAKE